MKPIIWVGSSKDDLCEFPEAVKDVMGYALWLAQNGTKHPDAKPLRGYRGAGVLEVVDDFDTDTYRAVYTVRFAEVIYVLHAFKKKSRKGNETPDSDLELINWRLQQAEQHYRQTVRK